MSTTTPSGETTESDATTLDRSEDSAITTLHRAMLGPLNTAHYLRHFARFEASDRAVPSWNWAASLCTLNWMIFRRLWMPAMVYVAALAAGVLLVFGLGRHVLQLSATEALCLLVALGTLAFLIPGGLGNALVYRRYRKRSALALAAAPTLLEACATLQREASTRQRLMWIGLGNVLLAGIVVSLWMVIGSARGPAARGTAATHAAATVAPIPAANTAPRASMPASTASNATEPASAASPAAAPASAAISAPVATSSGAAPLPAPAVPASMPAPVPAAAVAPPDWYPSPAAMATYVPRQTQREQAVAAAEPTRTAAKETAAAAPAEKQPTSREKRNIAKQQEREQKSASATAQPATEPASESENSSARRYVVNIGLYAQEANGQRVQSRLQGAGIKLLVEELDMPNGKRTRVRAGPYDTRAQADAAAATIRALQLEAVVTRQP